MLSTVKSSSSVKDSSSKLRTWTRIDTELPASELVPRMLYAVKDTLYLGARQGLFKLDPTLMQWKKLPVNAAKNSTVRAFVEHKGSLFVGCEYSGLFRSDDNGNTWYKVGQGSILNDQLWGMTSTDSALIVVTWPRFIQISFDKGETWKMYDNGVSGGGGAGVAGTIIPHKYYYFCNIFHDGVFKRGIREKSWLKVSKGLPTDYKIRSVIARGDSLLAGTEDGVYYSNDLGANWTPLNNGIQNTMIISFWIDGTIIFATSNEGKLLKSIDNGSSWQLFNEGLSKELVIYDFKQVKDYYFISGDGSGITESGVYFRKR